MNAHKCLIRQGLILMLVSLLGALFIPMMAIPRLGLSAHTIGVMSSSLLMIIGLIWGQLRLSDWQRRLALVCWLASAWANWAACIIGAVLGAGHMTPLASNGTTGAPASELIVNVLLTGVVVVSIVALGLSLWGLRSSTTNASPDTLNLAKRVGT